MFQMIKQECPYFLGKIPPGRTEFFFFLDIQ